MADAADDPVLFVHGYLGDLCDFGPLLLAMAERHRVVAFDVPGFGESTTDDAIASIDTYVRLIAELVARLGLKRVILVRHSMGAQVCIGVGLTSPSFVRSMTLIDAAGVYEPATFVGRLSKRIARVNVGEMRWPRRAGRRSTCSTEITSSPAGWCPRTRRSGLQGGGAVPETVWKKEKEYAPDQFRKPTSPYLIVTDGSVTGEHLVSVGTRSRDDKGSRVSIN